MKKEFTNNDHKILLAKAGELGAKDEFIKALKDNTVDKFVKKHSLEGELKEAIPVKEVAENEEVKTSKNKAAEEVKTRKSEQAKEEVKKAKAKTDFIKERKKLRIEQEDEGKALRKDSIKNNAAIQTGLSKERGKAETVFNKGRGIKPAPPKPKKEPKK